MCLNELGAVLKMGAEAIALFSPNLSGKDPTGFEQRSAQVGLGS
jgi:hypothetical protein